MLGEFRDNKEDFISIGKKLLILNNCLKIK